MNAVLATLDDLYLDNALSQWLWALAMAAGVLLTTVLVRRLVRRHYRRMAETEQIELMEVPLQIASKTTTMFLIVMSLFFGMLTLHLPPAVHHVAEKVLVLAVCWQVGIWATTGALAWINVKRRVSLVEDRAAAGTLGIIAIIVRALIWSVVLLLTLDNLGVNVTTLVAGLGIGGIAIALAVQNLLGDLLASLSITLDKPFVLGDFLIVEDFKGTVENIGIKTTRLRSLDGEQIVMPNADLLKSRMRNYGRMRERRVLFSVGVTYETPRAKLEKLPGMVRAIVEAQPNVRLDRCHLARLGAYSIDCEVVYFVLSKEYNEYMDIQQAINLQLIEAFEREQIEFAYPTQKQWTALQPGSAPLSDVQA
ncbi:MAG: mechanosensitive ion channel family protein [Steroidobacteraceae bacterium]